MSNAKAMIGLTNEELVAIEAEILSYQNCDKSTFSRVRELVSVLVSACRHASRFVTREYHALLHEGDDATAVQSRMIGIAKAAGVKSVGVSGVRRTEDGWSVQITMEDAKHFDLFDAEITRLANIAVQPL